MNGVISGASDIPPAPVPDPAVWKMEEDRRARQDQDMREAQAREIGCVEGETKAKAQYEELLRKERQKITEVLRQLAGDRARYFEKVESEVVQLAMAIARKVVHREAQIDPNLLMGLVRYTLDKLRDGTRIRVLVNPSNPGAWQQTFSGANLELVFDEKIEPGLCVVESELGTTSVSVDNQLKEIEQGLMDLLAQRPEAK
jgi:flagellar assembly protein FliH